MDETGNVNRRVAVLMEEVAVFSGLVMVQFLCAGNSAMLNYLQNDVGLSSSSIIIFSYSAIFLLLSPFCIYFERDKWPKKLSLKLLVTLVLISLLGVTLSQLFTLKGIKLTSPTMSNAMSNLCPGLIFIIATAFGLEKVDLGNIYSKVKIAGTLVCVSAAVTLSILKSTNGITVGEDITLNSDTIIGFLYLFASGVCMCSTIILQAMVISKIPAPVSLCAISSVIGVLITAIMELIQNHKLETGLLMVNSIYELVGYYLLMGVISGLLISMSLWALKKKGPVFISMFSPLGTVISAFLSYFTLGETFSSGSLVGMFIMFMGLYFFLWAKGKEDGPSEEDTTDLTIKYDMEKSLLSKNKNNG